MEGISRNHVRHHDIGGQADHLFRIPTGSGRQHTRMNGETRLKSTGGSTITSTIVPPVQISPTCSYTSYCSGRARATYHPRERRPSSPKHIPRCFAAYGISESSIRGGGHARRAVYTGKPGVGVSLCPDLHPHQQDIGGPVLQAKRSSKSSRWYSWFRISRSCSCVPPLKFSFSAAAKCTLGQRRKASCFFLGSRARAIARAMDRRKGA